MLTIKIIDENLSMEELLKDSLEIKTPDLGKMIEGVIVAKSKNKMYVDLGGSLTGIIAGREMHDSLDTAKSLKEGDTVSAVIVEDENEDGMFVLSLRKAAQIYAWERFDKAHKEGKTMQVVAQEANKGGLLLDIDGIKAFIPVSQLAPLHYPRVDNANANQILAKLEALIGIKFNVKVITINQEEGKLILSEKEAMADERTDTLKELQVGQKVEGVVSGVVKFGIFVAFRGIEGLVHISEIAWGHVKNPGQYASVGDKVEVVVIGVDGEKISLSMKRLLVDPWLKVAKTFKIGRDVDCVVNKVTQFGAFVTLGSDINGLIHISEIAHEKISDPKDYLSVGQSVRAKVISVDLDDHRIGLSLKALLPEPVKSEEQEQVKTTATKKKTTKKETEEEVKEKKVVKKKAEKKTETKTEKDAKAKTEPKVEKKVTKKKVTKAKKDEKKTKIKQKTEDKSTKKEVKKKTTKAKTKKEEEKKK